MRWLAKAFNTIAKQRNLPRHIVEQTVEEMLKTNLSIFFGAEVEVQVYDGHVEAWLFKKHPIPSYVPIQFENLPRVFIRTLKKLLPFYIDEAEADIKYVYWRTYKHTAITGTIIRSNSYRVDVELSKYFISSQIGQMLKPHFVPKEQYKPGQAMYFYVLKVRKELGRVNIYLSRNTISLPAAILKKKIPWGEFKCVRRIAGVKSEIVSNIFVPKELIREIAHELGEVVIVKQRTKRPADAGLFC